MRHGTFYCEVLVLEFSLTSVVLISECVPNLIFQKEDMISSEEGRLSVTAR